MAKNDNLTDFLVDVADAIRAKKGMTDKINPQDFSSEIASIEIGGGDAPTPVPSWTGHADADGLRAKLHQLQNLNVEKSVKGMQILRRLKNEK